MNCFARLLPLLVLSACTAHDRSTVDLQEMPFSEEPHEGCAPLFTVSGTGASQEAARAKVLESVAAGGGNAVVFVGARAARDPATGEVASYTERALAYACAAGGSERETQLREAVLRTMIARYDGMEEQFDDPVGRRYCIAFDATAETEGRSAGAEFLRRFADHPNVHARRWCNRHKGRLLSVGPIEWLGPAAAKVWSFSWVESRPGGADCLLRVTEEEGVWRVGEECERGLIYD